LDDFVGDRLPDAEAGGCGRAWRVADMDRAGLIDKQKVIDQFPVGGDGLSPDAGGGLSKVLSLNLGDQFLQCPHE
jgi:hypothetical protein